MVISSHDNIEMQVIDARLSGTSEQNTLKGFECTDTEFDLQIPKSVDRFCFAGAQGTFIGSLLSN